MKAKVPNGPEYTKVPIDEEIQSEKELKEAFKFQKLLKTSPSPEELLPILSENPKLINVKCLLIQYKKKYTPYKNSILPTIKYQFFKNVSKKERYELITKVVNIGFQNDIDTLFFSAANVEFQKLADLLVNAEAEILTKTREGDTPLNFLLKYGNYDKEEEFLNCLKILICKQNINQIDYSGKSPRKNIRNIPGKSDFYEAIRNVFNEKDAEFAKDTGNSKRLTFKEKTRIRLNMFHHLILGEEDKFERQINKHNKLINSDDGENTLLQLAVILKKVKIVKALLKKKVDPNKLTTRNTEAPVLIAAILNDKNNDIYSEIVQQKQLLIQRETFNLFLKHRSHEIKLDDFNKIFECKFVDPNMVINQKTPLFYAITFRYTKGIQSLLKNGASLIQTIDEKHSCLDLIKPSDLEEFLNSKNCIIFDNYESDIRKINYKMQFNFETLIDKQSLLVDYISEVELIRKMGHKINFKDILHCGLIEILIDMKWHLCKTYYKISSIFRLCYYLLLFCYLFSGFKCWLILLLFLIFQTFLTFLFIHFKKYKKNNIHSIIEGILLLLLAGTFISEIYGSDEMIKALSAVTYTTMALSYLLNLGYHPVLSKWSAMLQKVYVTFFTLLLFFSVLIISFALGFYHLVNNKSDSFKNVELSIFSVIVMLTGEFNASDNFINENINAYVKLFFIMFAICMTIILMNFWTGIAVSDIDKIESDYEIVAINNVIIFIQYTEAVYKNLPTFFKRILPNPFIFPENLEHHKYRLDCYINKQTGQFKENSLKMFSLDYSVRNKIEELYNKKTKETLEQRIEKMSLQLNDILKCIEETVTKCIEKKLSTIFESQNQLENVENQ